MGSCSVRFRRLESGFEAMETKEECEGDDRIAFN